MKIFTKKTIALLLLCSIITMASVPISAIAAPGKISGVKCGITTQNSINLSWKARAGVSGYQVYRAAAYDGTYQRIMNVNPRMQAFCNKKLQRGQEYYYKIRAYVNTGRKTSYGKFSKILIAHTKLGSAQNAVVRARVNMRKRAGTNHPVVTTLAPNTSVSIVCNTKDKSGATWSRVTCKANGRTINGYILSSLLKQQQPTKQQTSKKTGKVTASRLNVRSNAGTNYSVIASLKKGQKVTVLGYKRGADGANWYLIEFKRNGKTMRGYVSSRYIKI